MKHTRRAALPLAAALLLGGTAACSPGAGSSGSAGDGVFTTIDGNHPIAAGAPMNPFNAAGNTFLGYDTMQLGFTKKNPQDPNDFFPGLARSWKTTDTSITVELEPDAKWSDGTPVTAEDVRASMAIALTQGSATIGAGLLTQGLDVAEVRETAPHTYEISQVPGAKNVQFPRLVLTQKIVPASVYGALLPADVWDVIHTSQSPDPARADAAKAAVDRLNEIGKKVSAFAPAKDVSAGPFVLTRVNPGSAVLDRNPHFFAAAKIGPKQVVVRNYTGNEQIWSYMTNGELDAAPFTAIPDNVLQRILKAGNQRVDAINYVDAAIAFNQGVAPFDKVEVRRALAHVIDREAVTKVGQPVGGTASKATTGLIDKVAEKWLTPEQQAALDPYAHDEAKAAELLQQAGLTKKDGTWHLPDGTPWTITLQTVNGFSDWIAGGTVVANQLTAFGIPTRTALTADFSTYKKEMADGKYPVGFWLTALGPGTDAAFQRLYGVDDGFTAIGADVTHKSGQGSGNWLNTPTSFPLDGATVNPGELTARLTVLQPEEQKDIVRRLAALSNQQLPVIQVWDYTNVQFVNDKRFTDFPKSGQDGLLSNSPGVWMMQGYVQPKNKQK
ncbi:ABC transporter substrate-binding protein [Kitasatospora fiedleri]|uniref:ABC transporter substrate-binding protein n=1 Tax=Kitasatospora fiedleri TaxID=2991545 RepID=UPI002499F494|nr:ABC transporter substrate-binding protein [Kitasatospora fiedleri]